MQPMNLSPQAMGAIMMALQRSLMDQSDIVPMLENFQLVDTDNGLEVLNPPVVRASETEQEDA
tara:strand:- start:207 stop:395 length:189 start_codon:yes stop_codon:yes gene_type:complete